MLFHLFGNPLPPLSVPSVLHPSSAGVLHIAGTTSNPSIPKPNPLLPRVSTTIPVPPKLPSNTKAEIRFSRTPSCVCAFFNPKPAPPHGVVVQLGPGGLYVRRPSFPTLPPSAPPGLAALVTACLDNSPALRPTFAVLVESLLKLLFLLKRIRCVCVSRI